MACYAPRHAAAGWRTVEPLKIPLAEIPRIAGESLAVVYDAINLGHLETMLVGRRRFARPDAIRKWVDFLEAESNAGRPVMYRARVQKPDLPRGRSNAKRAACSETLK